MFSIANGGRPGGEQNCDCVNDGSQTQDVGAEDPGNVAEELRSMGYKVLAVGIGSGVNSTELAHIAGNKANVYSAVTFDELISQDFLGTVNKAGCDEAKKEVKPLCEVKVDVGFVLDSSGSLRNDYDKEKNFLKALAATFGVSEDGARAGVVTFSYDTEHSIKLNDHYDLFSFSDAVDKIPLMGHTTRIDKALRLTQSQMFSIANGGRRWLTFDELISQDFLGTVNKAGCDEAKKEVKPLCEVKVDVGFVLDSSGSLRNDYDKEKNFLKALAATFGVSEDWCKSRCGDIQL
ncbi:collagen alpha-6(VI) chain-like [Clytia hemisphaerica]|uniref:collagen alpha-6(VI) chain-like n=1 Tax=Clytia hemisphaerica TaxID=252671 RepID=UPI0034D60939